MKVAASPYVLVAKYMFQNAVALIVILLVPFEIIGVTYFPKKLI